MNFRQFKQVGRVKFNGSLHGKPTAFQVFNTILMCADDTGESEIAPYDIADETGFSVECVAKTLYLLENLQELEWLPHNGFRLNIWDLQ